MRAFRAAGAAATALALAACATGAAPAAPTPTVPTPVVLAYSYAADDAPVYDLTQTHHVVMTVDGDAAAAAGGVELPFAADVTSSAATELSYTVADGPTEGTYEITVHAAFPEVTVEGTVNGEPVDEAGAATGLGTMEPIDVTVVVDEHGRIVSGGGTPGPASLLGGVGGWGALGPAPGSVTRPFGPAFPEDRALTVGDTWTEETSETLPDGSTLTASTVHEVVAAEELDGIPVLVIDSTTETGAATIDLGSALGGMVAGFADAGAPPELRFVISLDPTTTTARTWFDPEAGTVRKATGSGSVTSHIDGAFPDGETGAPTAFTVDLTVDSDLAAVLRAAAA